MAYGIFRKVTTLEFLQHHFAKSGHGDGLLMTRQLISTFRQPPLHYLTRSVRRSSGFVLADHTGVTASRLESKSRVCQIGAKRGCWMYNADRSGTQNGNPCSRSNITRFPKRPAARRRL